MIEPLLNSQEIEDLVEVGRTRRHPGERLCQRNVVSSAQRRQQIVFLKHESDLGAPHHRALIFTELPQIHSVDQNLTRSGRSQPAQNMKQSRFPGARRSNDCQELAASNIEIDAAQCGHVDIAGVIHLLQRSHPNNGVAPRILGRDRRTKLTCCPEARRTTHTPAPQSHPAVQP